MLESSEQSHRVRAAEVFMAPLRDPVTDEIVNKAGTTVATLPWTQGQLVAFWLVIGLLILLGVLLVVLVVCLADYTRWRRRDTQHKERVEQQLNHLTQMLERVTGNNPTQ
jgi:hypothetical protein